MLSHSGAFIESDPTVYTTNICIARLHFSAPKMQKFTGQNLTSKLQSDAKKKAAII